MNTSEELKEVIIGYLKGKVLWAVCEKKQIYAVVREWVPCTELQITESEDRLTDTLKFHFGPANVDLNFHYHEEPERGSSSRKSYHLYKIN